MSDAKPPPRRVPEEKDGPLTDKDCAFLRENYVGAGGLSVYWGGRLFATLDAERAANAEMRRALEKAPNAGADGICEAGCCCCLTSVQTYPLRMIVDGKHVAGCPIGNALRAAEKAPETTEPAPPAGDGLTATPWGVWNLTYDTWAMPSVASWHASQEAAQRECDAWSLCTGCMYEPRVRAAAEKASTR